MKRIKLFEQFTSLKQNIDKLVFLEEPTEKHVEALNKEYKSMEGFPIEQFMNIPFPPNGSAETLAEIKHINGIVEEVGFIKSTDNVHSHFIDGLKNLGLKYDEKKWKNVLKESLPIIYKLKYHYNRPRPAQVARELGVDFDATHLKSAQTPSYPSGHSTQGVLISLLLSDEYPEHTVEIRRLGLEIGYGRLMAKVHYQSDHNLGVDLAKCLYEYIKSK
jgi:hypothetical protein